MVTRYSVRMAHDDRVIYVCSALSFAMTVAALVVLLWFT
jgi:hypothetical protein